MMMRLLASLCTVAVLVLAAPHARAEIAWSYIGDKEVAITSGASTVTFHGTVGSAANNTGIVIYNISAASTTANDGPADHFEKTPFSLTVSIIDEAARIAKAPANEQLGTMTFQGFFTADVTKGSLTNWSVDWDNASDFVVLGNNSVGIRKYELNIDGFLPPSPNKPSSGGLGTVHAGVTVTPLDRTGDPPVEEEPNPTPNETPEPASLVLAGIGLASFGAARRLRRRRENVEA
jgi:hypothetical protein